MSVRRDGDIIRLEGDCPVEEAEALAALLDGQSGLTADLSRCRQLHSALVQALLRFRPPIRGEPEDWFVREMVLPALRAGGAPVNNDAMVDEKTFPMGPVK